MRRTILSIAALALASVCPAQTPTPATGQSGWQLGQGFDLTLPQSSLSTTTPAPSVAASAAPATSAAQPAPIAPESVPAKTARDRNSLGAMSYVEGSIWLLTFVKIKTGLSDEYFKSISASLKPLFEEEKKQKLILDYKILSADSADERDFNVIIMVQYPNKAAVEARERFEPIVDKIIGPTNARRDLAVKRNDIRDVLATKTMREIWLK